MAIINKPGDVPEWANTGDIDVPSAGKRLLGWILEKPPFQFFNWWQNLVGQWTVYLDKFGSFIVYKDEI